MSENVYELGKRPNRQQDQASIQEDDKGLEATHVELPPSKAAEEIVYFPESIRNMSDAEIKALERRIVRKADMVIMCVDEL